MFLPPMFLSSLPLIFEHSVWFPTAGFFCPKQEDEVFTSYLTWGFCSKMCACNNCGCVLFLFSKRKQCATSSDAARSDALEMSFVLWPVRQPWSPRKHDECSSLIILSLPNQCEIWDPLKPPSPLPEFPSASQQFYKIFISILIVFFQSLSSELNAVTSDYSESRANPLRLFTEVTGMLARLCLEAHRAHSELLISVMSWSTLHSLPVTDPLVYMEWKQHGTD